MQRLTSEDISTLLLALGLLLTTAHLLGEIARRFNQPAIIGELLAGILLGPTVLGHLAPDLSATLFPAEGARAVVLEGLVKVAVVLFLLVAGMEVDLSRIWRQGRTAVAVSVGGLALPFGLGLLAGWLAPTMFGRHADADPLIFTLFLATALAISALPVIAKSLMDLNLYRTDLGMIVIASAIIDDLVGWIIFAVILGLMGSGAAHGLGVGATIGLTLAFAAFTLFVGRRLIDRCLPWLSAHASWPGGVLGFALSLTLLGAAFTEWIGVHAIFGAFMVGVALGDSEHLRAPTKATIEQFVSFIFAPLFFASIGLKVNFVDHFDGALVLLVLLIASVGKVAGCGLAAWWTGLPKREVWAVGIAKNARGAMEIILGLLALEHGVIDERMFAALVIMALVTSMMSGPLMQAILRLKKPRRFTDWLTSRAFVPRLEATGRAEAIAELAAAVCAGTALNSADVAKAVLAREAVMSTGLGHGVAVPHARLPGLTGPIVGVGLSADGIDFEAPDGRGATVIFLILTTLDDDGAQIEILADIARTFRDATLHERARRAQSYTQFLAVVRTGTGPDR